MSNRVIYDCMSMDLYSQQILQLCADILRLGRLPRAHGSATKQARLCGSIITVDVKLDGDRVSDFAQEVDACALGKAAASFFARHVIGKTYDELKNLRDTMRNMLENNGAPPQNEWAGLAMFEGVRDYPARHDSTMLVFDATVAAMEAAMKQEIVTPAKAGV